MPNREPNSENIHQLICRLLKEKGAQDPPQKELERDPTLAYGNIYRYYPFWGLDVSQCESCDGYLVSWVFRGKECLYKDRSYDGKDFRIVIYTPGRWEELLVKEQDETEYNCGCTDKEWIEWWRDNFCSEE